MSYRFAVINYLPNNLWNRSNLSPQTKKHVYTNIVIVKETNERKHNRRDYVIHFVIFKESKSKITTDGDSYVITFVINFQGE